MAPLQAQAERNELREMVHCATGPMAGKDACAAVLRHMLRPYGAPL